MCTASSQGISCQKAKKECGTVELTVLVKAREVTFTTLFQFLARCLFSHHHDFPSVVEPGVLIQLYCTAPNYFLTASSMAVNLYSLRVCFAVKIPSMSKTCY